VRLVYRILAMLIAAGVVVQAAAIAFALFDIEKKTDDGQIYSKDSHNGGVVLHSVLGEMVIPVIALLLLIVSFFAAIPGGVKWAAITFGVLVLQVVLAYAGDALPAIGVLHGINAFALAAVASIAMRKARLAESPAPAVAA
jgi:1,4-dihydroxy-2-naphthoate octaprenyltransferase